jgi:hypothetical protein
MSACVHHDDDLVLASDRRLLPRFCCVLPQGHSAATAASSLARASAAAAAASRWPAAISPAAAAAWADGIDGAPPDASRGGATMMPGRCWREGLKCGTRLLSSRYVQRTWALRLETGKRLRLGSTQACEEIAPQLVREALRLQVAQVEVSAPGHRAGQPSRNSNVTLCCMILPIPACSSLCR